MSGLRLVVLITFALACLSAGHWMLSGAFLVARHAAAAVEHHHQAAHNQ